jgi:hypothetical protein
MSAPDPEPHVACHPRPPRPQPPAALSPAAVAREITCAGSSGTRFGQAFIRRVENATGRISLIRRAAGYEADVAAGLDFWRVMTDRFALRQIADCAQGGKEVMDFLRCRTYALSPKPLDPARLGYEFEEHHRR